MKDAEHIYDTCIYNRPRLPGVVIHFKYNSESVNVYWKCCSIKFMNKLSHFDSDKQCHLLIFRPRPVRLLEPKYNPGYVGAPGQVTDYINPHRLGIADGLQDLTIVSIGSINGFPGPPSLPPPGTCKG